MHFGGSLDFLYCIHTYCNMTAQGYCSLITSSDLFTFLDHPPQCQHFDILIERDLKIKYPIQGLLNM